MEVISDVLQPYKELVGSTASLVTIGQMFSGCFICYDIYKQGNTKAISVAPFLGGLVIGLIMLKRAYILDDDKMINTNLAGLTLNTMYTLIYFFYTSDKLKFWKNMGVAGAFTFTLLGYAEIEDPNLVEDRFGAIITVFMLILIAMPLFSLRSIIKNKSTEGLPFPMIFSGTIVSFMWLLYSIILKNKYLLTQNVVAVVLCIIQLSLFVIYPSKPAAKEKVKVKTKKAE